jgi:predicted  nucleic acid-binding Zn-ribbon protein
MKNELIKQLAELNDKYQEVKAENDRLKSSLEQIRRCMVGWKSHLHPDLLTLKTIDKILIEHSNH